MASGVSDYFEQKILDHMLRNQAFTPPATVYASLHTASPGDTGASEAAGGSYARQAIAWNAAASPGGTMTNNGVINFTGMPAATITGIGIWDAVSAGNLLWWGDTTSKTTNSGDTYQIPDAALTVSLA
ncbi:MAG: hypothetical protein WAY02_09435 [Burkholderiaceae bacterium]